MDALVARDLIFAYSATLKLAQKLSLGYVKFNYCTFARLIDLHRVGSALCDEDDLVSACHKAALARLIYGFSALSYNKRAMRRNSLGRRACRVICAPHVVKRIKNEIRYVEIFYHYKATYLSLKFSTLAKKRSNGMSAWIPRLILYHTTRALSRNFCVEKFNFSLLKSALSP